MTPLSTPYRLRGRVVNGFGRGSKLLGCPTANLEPEAFQEILQDVKRGVYMGWAKVGEKEDEPVYKTVLSLGTNPQFSTVQDTVESYILHEFPSDFYGAQLSLIIVGFMRPMEKYSGLDELIRAISRDVRVGDTQLEKEPYAQFKNDPFFQQNTPTTTSANQASAAAVAPTSNENTSEESDNKESTTQ